MRETVGQIMNEKIVKQKKAEHELLLRFGSDGSLGWRKLREYILPMLITNLSSLLLVSVDGLVVGNLVGEKALASVNLFYPITMFIGTIAVWIASGCSTAISNSIGSNDQDMTDRIKGTTIVMMVFSAVFVAIVQIPVVYGVIYFGMRGLSPETASMMRQYAYGIMISLPFGLVSTVGVFQLQIAGKMKQLMKLAAMEGIANLLFDLLFVGAMDMGVAGAGYGTAAANVLRCVTTIIYISKKTEMYQCSSAKARLNDVWEILSCGMPEAANSIMLALRNYFIVQILLLAFGDDAGVIRGVCVFVFSLVNVLRSGIRGGMRPLIGFLSGAKDISGMRTLLRQCLLICAASVGAMTVFTLLFPGLFFHLHGVYAIPKYGEISLRLYSLCFVMEGFDTLFQLYFINRKESEFSTLLSVINAVSLVVISFLFVKLLPAPCVWLAYPVTALMNLVIDLWRYHSLGDGESELGDAELLYLSVRPEDAVEASRLLRDYATERGYSPRISNRLSLCMEEMVSYAVVESKNIEIRKLLRQKVPPELLVELLPDELFDKLMEVLRQPLVDGVIPQFPGDVLKKLPKELQEILQQDVVVYIIVRFEMDGASFVMIDTGRRIALNGDRESKELVTENYELIKRLSKSVDYQYVLDMNYSVVTFSF